MKQIFTDSDTVKNMWISVEIRVALPEDGV